MNICSGGNRNFSSVTSFDTHRTGSYQRGKRKCMSEAEMLQKDMHQQKNGCWANAGPQNGIVAWEKEVEA